ncbi:nitronate monooxygenase [Streptomyces hirsutus]
MSLALTDLLRHPVVQAPMAGGVAVPQLAAAVSEAGGLGFLAAGYKDRGMDVPGDQDLRGLTGLAFGVNVFMPQPETSDPAAVGVYAHQLGR